MRIIERVNGIRLYFKRYVIVRKVVTLFSLVAIWLALLLGGIFSPNREPYSEQQLNPKQTFENGTGEIELQSQTYSKKNKRIILEFETLDNTGGISKGINAEKLEWKLYAKNKDARTEMQVIPIVGNKISAVIKHVPDHFEAIAIDVKNTTVNPDDIDVNVQEYGEASAAKEEKTENSNTVQFIVSEKSDSLKQRNVKRYSRDQFAIAQLKTEKTFQFKQKKKLEKAKNNLERAIKDDQRAKEILERESQYLVGEDKTSNENDRVSIDRTMESKQNLINDAEDHIETVKRQMNEINQKIEDIQSGTYTFSSSVKTIKMNE